MTPRPAPIAPRTASFILALATMATRLSAQAGATPRPLEPALAPVAALPTALYNEQANIREPTDSARAVLATMVLRRRLRERLGTQLVPDRATDSAAGAPGALRVAGGVPCNVRVACAVAVGRALGASWVVLTKVSKTSNLIWLLSAQLIRVDTGEILLDDSTELKGEPDLMVRTGMRIFADRVIRTIRNGGRVTNFPGGEPGP